MMNKWTAVCGIWIGAGVGLAFSGHPEIALFAAAATVAVVIFG